MPSVAVILVPLLACVLLAGAVHLSWRRMPDASYAGSWLAAFWLAAFGWAAAAIETGLSERVVYPGGASVLCWLAAAFLAALGARRTRNRQRGVTLLAIWVGTAVGVALLQDLRLEDLALESAAGLILAAGGATLAAVALGPRTWAGPRRSGIAAGLLGGFVLLCLVGAVAVLRLPEQVLIAISALSILPMLLLGLIALARLSDDRAHALERLARVDPLTGAWNRRGFDEAAHHLLARHRAEGGRRAAVAIADIDGFKSINDTHGHAVGDTTLVRFCQTLAGIVEPGDLLARLGGEEFAILSLDCDAASLHHRLERARSLLGVPHIDPNGPPSITASFGVADFECDEQALREALERADRALYRAKSDGRNRVTLAE